MSRFWKFALCVAAGCAAFTSETATRAATYQLDNAHTSIIFGISHFGYSFTYGRFNEAKGQFAWDDANPAANKFQVAIRTASIDTNDAKRDGHLRGPDFFNANQFPQITFVSTKAVDYHQQPRPDGSSHSVTGNLTMHGVTKEVTLPMKKLGEGEGPGGRYRMGFNCQMKLKRSDFGMTNMLPAEGSNKGIGDEIAVTFSFEGIRQDNADSTPPQGEPASADGDSASVPTSPPTRTPPNPTQPGTTPQ